MNFNSEQVLSYYDLGRAIGDFKIQCPYTVDIWDSYSDESLGDPSTIEHQMINWIRENCNKKAYCAGDMFFYFEDEADLIAFKLRWL